MEKQSIKLKVRRDKEKPLSLSRALLKSACIHIILISLIIIFPPGSLINPKPPLNITWIELPKGTGDDIYGLKDTKELPKSTIEEQQKAIEEALKPLPKEEDKKVMPEPKKPEKKAPEKKAEKKKPAKKSGMSSALTKIDKMLEERRVDPEAAQVKSSGEGYKYGTSDKPNRVPVDDPDYLKYQALVRAKIMRQWVLPGAITAMPTESRPVVRIIVMISRSGDVISKRWASKSPVESLNASAMRAIERASPFPVPPERIKWEAYNEGFLIEFNAKRR